MTDPRIIMIVGGLIVAAILARASLGRVGVPPLVVYLAAGIALRALDNRTGMLGDSGRDVLHFLGTLGVIVLLFRVGLESKLGGLLRQLRSASLIWIVNILASAAAGYAVARYGFGFDLVPSAVVGVAMSATSVGIPARLWRRAERLETPAGERFLDVAELDDMSGVVLLGLLMAVLPTLKTSVPGGLAGTLAVQAAWFAARLAAFGAGCFLFSRYVEKRYTAWFETLPGEGNLTLVVAGTGIVIAALAAMAGFSVAIGAFFAGLAFSRDPDRVQIDASFGALHGMFTPFFFVNIGFMIDPEALTAATVLGLALLAAAVVGKFVGAFVPALACSAPFVAAAIGVSMIPRAEITLLIMERARAAGQQVVSERLYAAMVLVSAATCIGIPVILRALLRRLPKTSAG